MSRKSSSARVECPMVRISTEECSRFCRDLRVTAYGTLEYPSHKNSHRFLTRATLVRRPCECWPCLRKQARSRSLHTCPCIHSRPRPSPAGHSSDGCVAGSSCRWYLGHSCAIDTREFFPTRQRTSQSRIALFPQTLVRIF